MKSRDILIFAAASVLLTACNSSEETAAPAQEAVIEQPVPVLTPAPTATAAADGTALEAGIWTVTEDATQASAIFGVEGAAKTLSLSCDPSTRALDLELAAGTTDAQAWRLDAGGEAARIDMSPSTETYGNLFATVDQGLAIIAALGTQGATFTLTSPTGQRRQFPTHPGITRIIASCS